MSRMVRRLTLAGLALAATLSPALAFAQAVCPNLPSRTPPPREAGQEYLAEPHWRARVQELDRQIAGADLSRVDMVFIGDSLVQGWFPSIFQQFYGHRAPANLGVMGDFTQGALYRMAHGHWPASLRPKVAVVLLGTNNVSAQSRPEDIALGLAEVLRAIRAKSPRTKFLIIGLLPRGDTAAEPMRRTIEQVNALISRCADGSTILYSDVGSSLVDGYGRLTKDIAFDSLHLTMVGYAMLSAGIEPQIRQLLAQ
ncbi:GDSL-type esterase/lipase family protein [Teichococcus deserti]|uniref:GDSL-type esterase/lipase family protein n=1 Tax=Teichococcus deserti TaxID=1817963 RepID=UPI0009FAD352|nr:GDSL-type esterase/lipase family protein [Pseudoroseomonas deserti]